MHNGTIWDIWREQVPKRFDKPRLLSSSADDVWVVLVGTRTPELQRDLEGLAGVVDVQVRSYDEVLEGPSTALRGLAELTFLQRIPRGRSVSPSQLYDRRSLSCLYALLGFQ